MGVFCLLATSPDALAGPVVGAGSSGAGFPSGIRVVSGFGAVGVSM